MKFRLPNIQSKMPWISVMVMAVLSLYFLLVRNSDVLFMLQTRSLFNDTPEFLQQFLAKPAGLLQWAGCFFTQMFYYPALGSLVLIVMWTAIFFLMKKALRVPDAFSSILLIPLVCLLVSEIDLGYWIYYNTTPGYYFSQTLGMLAASALVLVFRLAAEAKVKYAPVIAPAIGAAVMVLLYRYIGVYSLAAAAALAVIMLLQRRWAAGVLYAVAVAVTPFLFRNTFDTLQDGQLFTAGLPTFIQSGRTVDASLSTPLEIAVLSLIVFAFIIKVGKWEKTEKYATIISWVLLLGVTYNAFMVLDKADYSDENYHAECVAYRAIEEQRWDDALSAISKVEGALTRQNIMFKNVALFNTGEIGNHMYDFDDKGTVPAPADSLMVNTLDTSAPLIYLHHGMPNYAYRHCMENQVNHGFHVANLKMMALCSIISGESKIAQKYLGILSHTTFYKEWAERYMPLARQPELIGKYPEFAKIRELYKYLDSYCDNDEGLCERFIVRYFSKVMNKESKYLQEMSLVYSIQLKNIKNFWQHYLLYLQLHKGEQIPEIYQQAAYMFNDLEPQSTPDIKANGIVFDQARIVDRYNQFDQETQNLLRMGLQEGAISSQTKSEFGNTFWWNYYFATGAKYY